MVFWEELLTEITATGIWAVVKRILLGQKPPVIIDIGEEISPNVTSNDLQEVYMTTSEIVDLKNKIAEEVSKSKWQDYIPYFKELDHYKQLVDEKGEREAVLFKLTLNLTNPLLVDKQKSNQILSDLIKKNNRLIWKIRHSQLRKEIEELYKIQDDIHRHWIEGLVLDTLNTSVNAQIFKNQSERLLITRKIKTITDLINILQREIDTNE